MERPDFVGFPKIYRLSREIIVTEKLDGTNAQVYITDEGDVFAWSRTRWITPQDDNYGFAKWVEANRSELLRLGPGQHFGEWWGGGIQRGYGFQKGEKFFSLFNTTWYAGQKSSELPSCVGVVPVLYTGDFYFTPIDLCLQELKVMGSKAAPGFMQPEGIVIFHTASQTSFKKTIDKDEEPKGRKAE